MEFLFPLWRTLCSIHSVLGVAWVPSTLIDFEIRYRHPARHGTKSLQACASKSLPQSESSGFLNSTQNESLWDAKSHSKGAPCVVIERSLGLQQHPYSSWQGSNSKKERLIQAANSTRPHFMIFPGSVWTTVISSCCFSSYFQYPHIDNLSNCFLLSKTDPITNPIYPQAPWYYWITSAYITSESIA